MKTPRTILGLLAFAAVSISACAADSAPAAAAPAAGAYTPATLSPEELTKVGNSGFNRNWTVDELYKSANLALNKGGRSFQTGEYMFQTIGCALCHHFGGGVGGIGPDLTGVGGKFGAREILESIIEPSAVISDLYSTVVVYTEDGKKYTGRPSGTTDTAYQLIPTPSIDPATGTMGWIGPIISIPNDKITGVEESGVSPMPAGLINAYNEDQIYDFLAYLISAGNPDDKMFRAPKTDAPTPPRIVPVGGKG